MARERNDHEPDSARSHATARRGRIDDESRRRLGQNLRLFYASVLEQPLPDRFTRLLDDLSATSQREPGTPQETETIAETASREGSS